MKKPQHLSPFLMLIILPLLWLCTHAHANPKSELEKVSLQLKWLHQFQFAGYYAADIKGFYEEEGLDVTIKERDLFKNNIEQVIQGESEYGIADSMIMLYQARGEPVNIVAPIFQHSPQVFLTLESSQIKRLEDFPGKRVSFYQKDTDGFPLLAMLHQNTIAVDVDRMAIKGSPEILANSTTDVYPAYLSNEPFYFYQKGINIHVFHPMNYGIDLYGDMVFTHHDEIKHHPDRVARFKRATIKGWEYALTHKAEIAQYIKRELKSGKSIEHLLYEADVIESTISASSIPIGTLNEGRLQYIQNLFQKHQLTDKPFDLSKGIYQPEKQALQFSKKEIAWMKKNPVVRVAIDNSWHPIEFVNQHWEYDGLAKDYFDYIHSKTGIQFVPNKHLTWSESVSHIQNGKLDIYGAVIKTPEREKYTDYTLPYLKSPMVIATQKGENYIPSLDIVKNKTLAVVKDYAAQELIESHYPHLKTLLVSNVQEGLHAVAKGKAYGYVDNLAVIGYHIQTEGLSNLQISGETPFKADVSMAIRKDWPELRSIIDKVFQTLDPQKQAELNAKWLQIEYKKEFDWRKAAYIAAPLLLILLVFLFYNRKLRKLNSRLHTTNKTLLHTQSKLKQTNGRLEILSVTDFLTGAYNRQHINRILQIELNRSARYGRTFSVLLIDLDDFKQVNDQYGHLVGDEVLKAVYAQLVSDIRTSDTLGRWGGEEFLVIMPNCEFNDAIEVANKLIMSISNIAFEQEFTQTASIGVAQYQANNTLEILIERADKNLYQAKHNGKNQSCGLYK